MIKINIQKRLEGSAGPFEISIKTEIKKSSLTAISGVSGSGKTTLVRILAGLTEPDDGQIIAGGKVWYDKKNNINCSPQERKIGFVFQEFSLFPNMTVIENIVYAGANKKQADELLGLIELESLAHRYPSSLSGGQKQRVALARAIARGPELLILDEPFSTLDQEMKAKLHDEILKIHKTFNLTIILVSHDMAEIFKLSSRLISIDKGKVIWDGSPSGMLTNRQTSQKLVLTGEIIDIKKADILYSVLIVIGSTVSEVILTGEDIKGLHIGDKVMVAVKAFQPIVKKIYQNF